MSSSSGIGILVPAKKALAWAHRRIVEDSTGATGSFAETDTGTPNQAEMNTADMMGCRAIGADCGESDRSGYCIPAKRGRYPAGGGKVWGRGSALPRLRFAPGLRYGDGCRDGGNEEDEDVAGSSDWGNSGVWGSRVAE
ncbi:hypothetical protein K438DRAFT_1783596 [Mycena galopus ATCC 62051]|nr:hypothetical protein K438DRAFT_1783596 [Mycena galopus ATCC 62051]